MEREPPNARAILHLTATTATGSADGTTMGLNLDLDPLEESWPVTRVDLTSPTRDGNTSIGLRMLAPLTWQEDGEQRTTGLSGDFEYDVASARSGGLWTLNVVPANAAPPAAWLSHLDLSMRTYPSGQGPWDQLQLRVRSDANDVASVNADLTLRAEPRQSN